MANRKENGFRQIDNELWLAVIKADITRSCYKVLLTVIHYTLGYNQRTEAEISISEFENKTDLSRPAIKEALRILIDKNIIGIQQKYTNRTGNIYTINTDHESWVRGKASLPSRVQVNLPSNDDKTYPPGVENLPSRGKVPTSKTTYIKKKERKLSNKTNTSSSDEENSFLESTEVETDGWPACSISRKPPSEDNHLRFTEEGTPICDNCASLMNVIPPGSPFDTFWKAYPRKVAKQSALRAFEKAMKITDLDTILQAIEAQSKSSDRLQENGKFIPYPDKWLRGHRWEDEVQAPRRSIEDW
ncbi:MAG: replication protein [Dehalococcoidia bacterium]|nr:MAG: replication protein [Dehalococcoidia bacterium]